MTTSVQVCGDLGAAGLVDLIRNNLRLRTTNSPLDAGSDAFAAIRSAAELFKTLGHETRLLILLNLLAGEKSVTELENILDARQPAVSQHLARLRQERIVTTRREGQSVHYAIADERARLLLLAVGGVYEGTRADGA